MTDAMRDARDVDLSTLATKTDLGLTRADFGAGMAAMRAEMLAMKIEQRADMEALRAELLKWIFGMFGGVLALARMIH